MSFKDTLFGGGGGDLKKIARRLRNFKPIRFSSLMGASELNPRGLQFTPTEEFGRYQQQLMDLFGRSVGALEDFDPATASANTLALLRRRRAEHSGIEQSRLESRLLQQGRSGVTTGDRGVNPEMTNFFTAEAFADLEAQLVSEEEARRQGQFLGGQAAGLFGLNQAAAMPDAGNFFTIADMIMRNNQAAAGIAAQGAQMDNTGLLGRFQPWGLKLLDLWGEGAFSKPKIP